MGSFFCNTYNSIGSLFNKKTNTIMLGIDAAGKTTILYQLQIKKCKGEGDIVSTMPEIGFYFETFSVDNITINCWDLGGCERRRHHMLTTHMEIAQAIIFVIDSNDRDRIEFVKEELYILLKNNLLSGKPLLIFANKQDLNSSMYLKKLLKCLI